MIKEIVKQYKLTGDNRYLEKLLNHLDGTLTKYATRLTELNDSAKTVEDYYNDLVLSLIEVVNYTDPDNYSVSQYSSCLYSHLLATLKKLTNRFKQEVNAVMLGDVPSELLMTEDTSINLVDLDDLLKHSLTAKQYNAVSDVILEGTPKIEYARDNEVSVQAVSQICKYALHKVKDSDQLSTLLTV